ncbi:MAG: hypothetical protein U5L96_17985 [Owenweeksia sp.]|nr:hypothetical protein [Owenweeksia sp.]
MLTGYYRQDAVFGTGWAGNLWTAGFKGEANYYLPLTGETESNFTASLSAGSYVWLWNVCAALLPLQRPGQRQS